MPGRAVLTVLFGSLVSAATLTGQSPAPRIRTPSVLPIVAITVTGNKTLSTDAILAVSGLKMNQDGSAAVFDAARDRLLDTGYFDVVSYSFRQQNLGFAIAFTVTEMTQVYPIYVEALPITREQVMQLLKANDPLFDGLLPGTKKVIDRAATAVEQFLATSNPEIRVRAKVAATGPENYEIQFAPAEGLPVIADVTFEGSNLIKSAVLHEVMVENGIGQAFSDANIHAVLNRFIRPLFEKQGYMRVSFPRSRASRPPSVKGVDVHVTIVDGTQYRLGTISVRGAIMSGPLANDTRRILRMANVSRGEFVNGDEITQGVARIHDTLRGEGYLDETLSPDQ